MTEDIPSKDEPLSTPAAAEGCRVVSDILSGEQCGRIANLIGTMLQHVTLDLRGLREIEFTSNYQEALSRLGERFGEDLGLTNNGVGVGTASARHFWESGEPIHYVVAEAWLGAGLLDPDNEAAFVLCCRTLLHELGHVCETNISARSLPDELVAVPGSSITDYLRNIALGTWQEFLANFIAAQAHDGLADHELQLLRDCLEKIPALIRESVADCRVDQNSRRMLSRAGQHIDSLFSAAAYVLGTLAKLRMIGNGAYAEVVNSTIEPWLTPSHFRDTWEKLGPVLEKLLDTYPEWSGLDAIRDLMQLILGQLRLYGIDIRDLPGGPQIFILAEHQPTA